MFGYQRKILRVDLTERRVKVEELDDSVYEKYIGGSGIGAKYLYEETSSETDPLGPDNLLMASQVLSRGPRFPLQGGTI